MNRLSTWSMVIGVCIMASCRKAPQPDTAVLPEHTLAIIDYFLDETESHYTDENVFSLEGCFSADSSYYYLYIYATDSLLAKPYGICGGVVHYRGYDISLFGNSWNDYFWSSDTTYSIPKTNSRIEDEFIFYDPIGWTICIYTTDTTIIHSRSDFPILSSMPIEEYRQTLCDSLQAIIKH